MSGFSALSLPDLRAAVQHLNDSVTVLDKTNRVRKASLIERKSDLFARKHRADSMELELNALLDRHQVSLSANRSFI
jgi:hypothetical protein